MRKTKYNFKNPIILIIFILTSITCYAQKINATFQGGIEGVSPFLLHLQADNGSVEGFYKYLTDSVVVRVKGSLDNSGKLLLRCKQNPYPRIEGKLAGRLIEGEIVFPGKAGRHPFYAVDFRGEYHNRFHDYFRIVLAGSGYTLMGLSGNDKEEVISTFSSEDGSIGLRADSLNAVLYFIDEELLVDISRGLPLFMSPYVEYNMDGLRFKAFEEIWSGDSFVEFPEKNEEFKPEGILRELDTTISIKLTQIPRSEYIIGKWIAPGNLTYKAITNFDEAKKLLGEKMKPVEKHDPESGELIYAALEITYNDGTVKTADWLYHFFSYPEAFYAYYPELDILVMESEAAGDEVIDFNDSSSRRKTGNPARTATSPDGKWRVTGYYPGGAADTDEWWLEKWNPSLKKYEMALDFTDNYRVAEEPDFQIPGYIDGWLWIDDRTVLFQSQFPEGVCYKLELISELFTYRNAKP